MIDELTPEDPYANIRPYTNSEAPVILARLAADPELINALSRLRFPRLHQTIPGASRFFVRAWLRRKLGYIRSVDDLQLFIKPHLERVIEKTAAFSCSGLETLGTDESWLFISNHRDIAMDPALCNLALHRAGHRTLSIAIGSNLLQKRWVADLMRLNKSFVVRRDTAGPRDLLAASRQLSSYIREVITGNRGPVWIAQREGRAKDGRDATEPAVIKMLSLSRDKRTESLGSVLEALNVVPVAISYELDPCDVRKAQELAAGDDYQKADFEDVASIGLGISGDKGCVHLAFGRPVRGPDLTVDGLVAAIDRHVRDNYAIFPTNQWAWERLHDRAAPSSLPVRTGRVDRQRFDDRVSQCPEPLRMHLLTMYANPVSAWLDANGGQAAIAG